MSRRFLELDILLCSDFLEAFVLGGQERKTCKFCIFRKARPTCMLNYVGAISSPKSTHIIQHSNGELHPAGPHLSEDRWRLENCQLHFQATWWQENIGKWFVNNSWRRISRVGEIPQVYLCTAVSHRGHAGSHRGSGRRGGVRHHPGLEALAI